MNAEATILELEHEFWKADPTFHARHNAADLTTVIDGDITGYDASVAMIEEVPALTRLEFDDVAVRRITGDCVTVAYRATAERQGESETYVALVGSVYVRRGSDWLLVFHQHTPQ